MSAVSGALPAALAAAGIEEVTRPASPDELFERLRAASVSGRRVAPFGAGSALGCCGRFTPGALGLDLGGLRGVVEHSPGDLTVAVRAGTTLAELAETIAAHGQWLPGADFEAGSVGGAVACGVTAPFARGVHGRLRDRVLGMTVASPDGRRVRSGGRVVKNVAGYDLHRLHTGACGALGLVVECTFRLEPLPEAAEVVAVRLPPSQAGTAWAALRTAGLEIGGTVLQPGAEGARLTASFLGDREAVASAAGRAREVLAPFGTAVSAEVERRYRPPWAALPDALGLRVFARPTEVASGNVVIDAGPDLEREVLAYPDAGEIHVALRGEPDALGSALDTVASRARGRGFAYRVEQLPAGLDTSAPAFSAGPEALRLLARLKRAFEPRGILGPAAWSAAALERAAAFFESDGEVSA